MYTAFIITEIGVCQKGYWQIIPDWVGAEVSITENEQSSQVIKNNLWLMKRGFMWIVTLRGRQVVWKRRKLTMPILKNLYIYLSALCFSYGTWTLQLWSPGSVLAVWKFSHFAACGILAPKSGMEPKFPALQDRLVITGSLGKSPNYAYYEPGTVGFFFSHKFFSVIFQ